VGAEPRGQCAAGPREGGRSPRPGISRSARASPLFRPALVPKRRRETTANRHPDPRAVPRPTAGTAAVGGAEVRPRSRWRSNVRHPAVRPQRPPIARPPPPHHAWRTSSFHAAYFGVSRAPSPWPGAAPPPRPALRAPRRQGRRQRWTQPRRAATAAADDRPRRSCTTGDPFLDEPTSDWTHRPAWRSVDWLAVLHGRARTILLTTPLHGGGGPAPSATRLPPSSTRGRPCSPPWTLPAGLRPALRVARPHRAGARRGTARRAAAAARALPCRASPRPGADRATLARDYAERAGGRDRSASGPRGEGKAGRSVRDGGGRVHLSPPQPWRPSSVFGGGGVFRYRQEGLSL